MPRKEKENPENPLDNHRAIKQMMSTRGWKIFKEKIEDIGGDYMEKVLNIDLPPGKGFTKRDLHAYQCEVVKAICNIPDIIEEEANAYMAQQKAQEEGKKSNA